MKLGVEIQIDVTKIEKSRIYEGKKGKYLTATVFLDIDNQDQYGNNGMVTHKKNEGEERAPILGNAKIFWNDSKPQAPKGNPPSNVNNGLDDNQDIPF